MAGGFHLPVNLLTNSGKIVAICPSRPGALVQICPHSASRFRWSVI